jgi:ABC-type antimicrobial peptide transport system permease subunit
MVGHQELLLYYLNNAYSIVGDTAVCLGLEKEKNWDQGMISRDKSCWGRPDLAGRRRRHTHWLMANLTQIRLATGGEAGIRLTRKLAMHTSPATMISAPVLTPLWLPLFAIAFATMIGVISGIYPALRAIRLDPIAALRYE